MFSLAVEDALRPLTDQYHRYFQEICCNAPILWKGILSMCTATSSSTASTKGASAKNEMPSLIDCSNPQQGTEAQARILALSPASNDQLVGKQDGIADKAAPKPRVTLKIPPTVKDDRKLFVGGLPSDVTSEEFHTFFQQFGKVMDSVVMFDRDTHRSRGFGFVSFHDPAVCEQILRMGNEEAGLSSTDGRGVASGHLNMRGKIIEVKSAQPKGNAASTRTFNHNNRNKKSGDDKGLPQSGATQWQQQKQVAQVAQAPYYGHPAHFYGYQGGAMDGSFGLYYAQVAAGYPMQPFEPHQVQSAMVPNPYNQAGGIQGGVNHPPYYGFYPTYYQEVPYTNASRTIHQESVMQEVSPGVRSNDEKPSDGDN